MHSRDASASEASVSRRMVGLKTAFTTGRLLQGWECGQGEEEKKGRKQGEEMEGWRQAGLREARELLCPVFQGDLYFEVAAAVILARAAAAAHAGTLRVQAPGLGAHPTLFPAAHLEPGVGSG